jgi:hypothetical protein
MEISLQFSNQTETKHQVREWGRYLDGLLISGMLSDYLASLTKRKWQPGILDCGVFMADWVVKLCGCDPIADVRGTYSTERQFLRIVRREGGFENACAARLKAVGFRAVRSPSPGDILTVLAPYAVRHGKIQKRPTGAICVSETMRAVITSDLGVVIAGDDRLPKLNAWTINA